MKKKNKLLTTFFSRFRTLVLFGFSLLLLISAHAQGATPLVTDKSVVMEEESLHQRHVGQLVVAYFAGVHLKIKMQQLLLLLQNTFSSSEIIPAEQTQQFLNQVVEEATLGLHAFEKKDFVQFKKVIIISNISKSRSALSRLNTLLLGREMPSEVTKLMDYIGDSLRTLMERMERI